MHIILALIVVTLSLVFINYAMVPAKQPELEPKRGTFMVPLICIRMGGPEIGCLSAND